MIETNETYTLSVAALGLPDWCTIAWREHKLTSRWHYCIRPIKEGNRYKTRTYWLDKVSNPLGAPNPWVYFNTRKEAYAHMRKYINFEVLKLYVKEKGN